MYDLRGEITAEIKCVVQGFLLVGHLRQYGFDGLGWIHVLAHRSRRCRVQMMLIRFIDVPSLNVSTETPTCRHLPCNDEAKERGAPSIDSRKETCPRFC